MFTLQGIMEVSMSAELTESKVLEPQVHSNGQTCGSNHRKIPKNNAKNPP